MSKQNIVILGSTGSVGESTLDVIQQHSEQFNVVALTANTNTTKLLEQCAQFEPSQVVMVCEKSAQVLSEGLIDKGLGHIRVASGYDAIGDVVALPEVNSVVSAIVGAAGLLPTLEAVQQGLRVLIANKEPLVMTGDLLMREAQVSGATILPIDSEHNAIYQCLPLNQTTRNVNKIHLTASGGPFCGQVWQALKDVTPAQACAHPNWSMGQKISVDSATMMNKGLELIEASALFGLPVTQVEILIHPQSIIHSLVEYCDGSLLAQLGAPDMRIPIAHALAWPERFESGAATLSLVEIARLDFYQPDLDNLPCLNLATRAAHEGGSMPAVLNAANEVAVAAFLQEKIGFTQIPRIIEAVMNVSNTSSFSSIDDVLNIDNDARKAALQAINSLT